MKTDGFSTFWWFSTKLDDSERVFGAEIIVVNTRDLVCSCDSKLAHKTMVFLPPELTKSHESCGELAFVERVWGQKIALLGVVGLA